ncbi:SRPBCC family protein [Rathayibacter toxicus]|uniref:SRPBCC family protein n=1 Tax=Rathayibacter toxicus TaxID=145458 RepID=A0A2S5Y880_9MICO|nr:SRPBCC family protein [Rathayibacter toxicus]PPG22946.1 SRPBCC family protein [Rathayibacter toxicus]PPG47527.1 SRPBCC family protein [Rathayibacter toxicus]PPH24672.1 SRPBCC family protein [Rathayibacter toxicus]PPH58598.1 SRPBCC family protein [Rathayibacter toxicus]PPH60589.1 SRPBCC family protein [Rathayibacter toxicus]
MSHTTRIVACSPESVFAVFASGWLVPAWVVGASRMRAVDPDYPHVGSQLHHSFGVWPFVINDRTTVVEWVPSRRFSIQAAGWPMGEARVRFTVEPHPRGCRLRMKETPVKGPGVLIPAPLLHPVLWIRNVETLRRLAHLAEPGACGRVLPPSAVPSPRDRHGLDRQRRLLPRFLGAVSLVACGALGARLVVAARTRSRQ